MGVPADLGLAIAATRVAADAGVPTSLAMAGDMLARPGPHRDLKLAVHYEELACAVPYPLVASLLKLGCELGFVGLRRCVSEGGVRVGTLPPATPTLQAAIIKAMVSRARGVVRGSSTSKPTSR